MNDASLYIYSGIQEGYKHRYHSWLGESVRVEWENEKRTEEEEKVKTTEYEDGRVEGKSRSAERYEGRL